MPVSAITSPHQSIILENLQFQGNTNDCGPSTTATVINALLDRGLEAESLAAEMNKPHWRGLILVIRRIPNWATFPWGMVDVFRQHGLDASWRFKATPEYLKDALAQGLILMPIIGSWKPLWAHVMTLLVYSEDNRWGFGNTQFPHHNLHWVSDETFQRQWKATGRLLVKINI
jgi:hypothetical protein